MGKKNIPNILTTLGVMSETNPSSPSSSNSMPAVRFSQQTSNPQTDSSKIKNKPFSGNGSDNPVYKGPKKHR